MLYFAPNVSPLQYLMKLRPNKPLRNLGIYKVRGQTLILWKRSEELSFLFSEQNWNLHGPVDYRVSHGMIFRHGGSTGETDDDLVDTGLTAKPPSLSNLLLDERSHNQKRAGKFDRDAGSPST